MEIIHRGEGESLQIRIGKKFSFLKELEEVSPEQGVALCAWMAKQFRGMPGHSTKPIRLPQMFCKKEFTNRICFYGGTFQSWHEGHQACLDLCPEEHIIVVPDNNPWKNRRSVDKVWGRYFSLCRLLASTPYSVYPGLISLRRATPTVDWLPLVACCYRRFIIGEDNFLTFDRWKNYKILTHALDTLYIVPRGGDKARGLLMKEHLLDIQKDLKIVFLPHHPYEDKAASKKIFSSYEN